MRYNEGMPTPEPVHVVLGGFDKPPNQMTDEEIKAWADSFFDELSDSSDSPLGDNDGEG
jgi:hypothetical protein